MCDDYSGSRPGFVPWGQGTEGWGDMADHVVNWRRSSHCGEAGSCVEVAHMRDRVLLRDSTDPDGPTLVFSHTEWAVFLHELGRDEIDG
jgi:hypothetical protein